MVSFQQDLLLTINNYNDKYYQAIDKLFNDEELMQNLSLEEAEKLVKYIIEYKMSINSSCEIIDKILNVKKENNINEKIERELLIKMIPIMSIYRTLLIEKYSDDNNNNSIEDND